MIRFIRKTPKSILLLISIFYFVFILPLIKNTGVTGLTGLTELMNTIAYSLILFSIFSIIDNKTKFLRYLIILAVSLIWMMYYSEHVVFEYIAFIFSTIVFVITTGIMIKQIVSSKTVSAKVIVETISGYLLIGVIFGFLNSILFWVDPNSIGLGGKNGISNIMYYSFITVTTIGYGDISPISQAAKSLSILFGIISQLYLTIIMALIIGKFLNEKK
jgi:hypothetical protein